MKLRFLMSHYRKNSVRNKSDRKEVDLFREKHTPQTECGPSGKTRLAPGMGLSLQIGVGNLIG